MIRAADRVLVMFHHHQRVAVRGEFGKRVEQDAVVARVQTSGRLIEYIADTAQVGAELRGEADALRLTSPRASARHDRAPGSRARRAPGSRDAVRISASRSRAMARSRLSSLSPSSEARGRVHRYASEAADRFAAEAHRPGDRIEPFAMAGRATRRLAVMPFVPGRLLTGLLGVELFEFDAGAEAARTPALLAVEGEQPRVELGETRAALRTGALGREHHRLARAERQHLHNALAVLQGFGELLPQVGLAACRDAEARHRQLDVVLLEAVEPWPGLTSSRSPSTRNSR
jgi:hypothetical protein